MAEQRTVPLCSFSSASRGRYRPERVEGEVVAINIEKELINLVFRLNCTIFAINFEINT